MSDTEKLSKQEKKERKLLKKELKKEQKEQKKLAKRTAEELEEIEIDLSEPAPLSKKQKRLLRQGKITTEELEKKQEVAKPVVEEDESKEEPKEKKPKSEFAVWIGNLSFDTTKEELVRFLVAKTSELVEFSDDLKDTELAKITEADITRVNLPKKEKKIKGFAYIDFEKLNHMNLAISLSEQVLNGRKVLIKNAQSFEGRPKKDPISEISKNPPSRILFVGNLSFDTTKELLEEHFQSCGEIVKIRMATFEDSGKCKGFAFIDFRDEKGPTTLLMNKIYKKLINRPLRLEFGEDRSKRNPGRKPRPDSEDSPIENKFEKTNVAVERPHQERQERQERQEKPQFQQRPQRPQRVENNVDSNQRLKSSVALANAQRASSAIVKSTGKKITFD